MKNKLFFLLLSVCILATQSVFAHETRYQAMGGAFTAIGDDENTIKANPAGLAFITDNALRFSTTMEIAPTFDAFQFSPTAIEELGGIDPYWLTYDYSEQNTSDPIYDYQNWYSNDYDIDTGSNAGLTYNDVLAQMGFASNGQILSRQDLYGVYSWYDLVSLMELFNDSFNNLGVTPEISFIDRNIGLLYNRSISLQGTPTDTADQVDIVSESELSGGFAARIGHLSLGLNAVYNRSSTVTIDTPEFSDYQVFCNSISEAYGMYDPDEIAIMALTGDLFDQGVKDSTLTFGAGAMVDMGSLTVGAAIDDVADILSHEGHIVSQQTIEAALEQLNVGIAYESNRRKQDGSTDFINMLLAADIHNLGDQDSRSLHMGAELGLSLAEWITTDFRAGYAQDLDVSFEQMFDNGIFDIDEGEFSIGMGAKLLIAEFDMALSLPGAFAQAAFFESFNREGSSFEDILDGLDADDGPTLTITGSFVF